VSSVPGIIGHNSTRTPFFSPRQPGEFGLVCTCMGKRIAFPVVLIIEADCQTAELYRRALSTAFRVYTCLDPREATDLLTRYRPSVMVLEPAAQGGRGWDLLAAIQRQPGGRGVPVVLCSTLDERRKGMEMGAAAYLVKPVLPSTLCDALLQVIHSREEILSGA